MPRTERYRTNLNCGSCVAKIKPYLDAEPSITRWSAETASPDRVLTVEGDGPLMDVTQRAVGQAGFRILGAVEPTMPVSAAPAPDPTPTTYYPLLLLLGFLVGAVALAEVRFGSFEWERAMALFMGGFFLAFSFFKLLDLRGFADTYRMYDVVAGWLPAYAYVYPFIELALGAAYVSGVWPVATSVATVVVMGVGIVGVVRSLLSKRKVRCACLGTVFNLPMSTVTLVEDGVMLVMAAVMLATGPHGAAMPAADHHPAQAAPARGHAHSHDHSESSPPAAASTLRVLAPSSVEVGTPTLLRLVAAGPGGVAVREFEVTHEEKVHLIVVRDGLDTFAHLHPQVGADGELTVEYRFPAAGRYRLYADFRPKGGAPTVVTATLEVAGHAHPAPPLAPTVPGRVTGDTLAAAVSVEYPDSEPATVRFRLMDLAGAPVEDLRPYLGAAGHLVVLSRDGEQFVHAHPVETGATSHPTFLVHFPGAGLYKGWAQFQRGNSIQTLPFVIDVPPRSK